MGMDLAVHPHSHLMRRNMARVFTAQTSIGADARSVAPPPIRTAGHRGSAIQPAASAVSAAIIVAAVEGWERSNGNPTTVAPDAATAVPRSSVPGTPAAPAGYTRTSMPAANRGMAEPTAETSTVEASGVKTSTVKTTTVETSCLSEGSCTNDRHECSGGDDDDVFRLFHDITHFAQCSGSLFGCAG